MSEDELIGWLKRRLDGRLIGDDAAVLPPAREIAVTVDSQIAGVHFVRDLDPAIVARRLLAVNLSDIAAMGARPCYAFLALAAPHGFDHRRFFRALLAACAPHRLRLAGGDLAHHPHGCMATLTVLGAKARGGRWLRRGGASPGEQIWLGGPVGESAAGQRLMAAGARLEGGRVTLPAQFSRFASGWQRTARRAVRRHLQPQPQLELGAWLARQPAGGAMDVSDGVGRDLRRLCRQSGAGVLLDTERLPLAPGFSALCAALDVAPLDLALGGGEDYVLLFSLPAGIEVPARFGCHRVGTLTAGRRVLMRLRDRSGFITRDLPALGWDHLDKAKSADPGLS